MVSETAQSRGRSSLEGPRIVVASLLFFGGACAVAVLASGSGEDGVRAAIGLTARTSALLLLVVFPASAMLRRWDD